MIGEGAPNEDIKPLFVPGGSGSRIRISARLLNSLGWSTGLPHFECVGLFRLEGELLVAPTYLSDESGVHPFEPALRVREMAPESNIVPIAEIPPARVIAAPSRVLRFEGSWVGEEKRQLDLKVGVEVCRRLGWQRGKDTKVFPLIWGSILLLLSEPRFSEIQAEDFTGGHFQL